MSYRPGAPATAFVGASLLILGASLLLAPEAATQPVTVAPPVISAPPPAASATAAPTQASYTNASSTLAQPSYANVSNTLATEQPAAPIVGSQTVLATLDERVEAEGHNVAALDPELECMAMVIHHEAANQSVAGQLAVAQLILNRVSSPLFPKSICAVVNQPGQFFSTARYHAPADERWHIAVGVARVASAKIAPQVEPGALFYHAAYAHPSWAHRRTVVGRLGNHIFYR
jgi:spore germination cell wall hydrolase CwlJ-like protein